MHDIGTVVWKEWRELLRQPGAFSGRGGYQLDVPIVLMVGLFVYSYHSPWFALTGFLLPGVYSGLFIRGPVSFAIERERGTLESVLATRIPSRALFLGKALFEISYSCCVSLAAVVVGAGLIGLQGGAAAGTEIVTAAGAHLVLVGVPAVALLTVVPILVSMRSATTSQAHQRTGVVLGATFLIPAAIVFVPWILLRYGLLQSTERLLDLAFHLATLDTHVLLSAGALILLALNALAFRTGLAWSTRFRLMIA